MWQKWKKNNKFEAFKDGDVAKKVYLDAHFSKKAGHILYIEKIYNEFILCSNKQPEEDVVIERAVQTTIQILNDIGLFDNFDDKDEVAKDYILSLVNKRRRPNWDQWWCTAPFEAFRLKKDAKHILYISDTLNVVIKGFYSKKHDN